MPHTGSRGRSSAAAPATSRKLSGAEVDSLLRDRRRPEATITLTEMLRLMETLRSSNPMRIRGMKKDIRWLIAEADRRGLNWKEVKL